MMFRFALLSAFGIVSLSLAGQGCEADDTVGAATAGSGGSPTGSGGGGAAGGAGGQAGGGGSTSTWHDVELPPIGPEWEDNSQWTLGSMWGTGEDDIYLLAGVGYMPGHGPPSVSVLLHYDGDGWAREPLPGGEQYLLAHLTSIAGAGPNDVWVVGSGQVLIHNDGTGWQAATNAPADMGDFGYDAWSAPNGDVWLAGSMPWGTTSPIIGRFHRFDGNSWSSMSSPADCEITSVWGLSAQDVWATCGSAILRFDGGSWEVMHAFDPGTGDSKHTPYAIWGTAPNDLWVMGSNGMAWHFDGLDWDTNVPVPLDQHAWDIWGTADHQIWAWATVSLKSPPNDGAILRFDGAEWQIDLDEIPRVHQMWGTSATNIYAAGLRGTLLHYY